MNDVKKELLKKAQIRLGLSDQDMVIMGEVGLQQLFYSEARRDSFLNIVRLSSLSELYQIRKSTQSKRETSYSWVNDDLDLMAALDRGIKKKERVKKLKRIEKNKE